MDQNLPNQTPENSAVSAPNSSWMKPLPIVIVLALLAAVGFGGYYLGTSNQAVQTISTTPTTSLTQATTPTEKSSAIPNVQSGDFKKRLFDPNEKIFQTKEYPAEITSLKDEDLIGLKCTPYYTFDPEQQYNYYDTELRKHAEVIDPNLRTIIDNLGNQAAEKRIDSLAVCDTVEAKKFAMYGNYRSGGGAPLDSFFHWINADNTTQEFAKIPAESTAYFGCTQPLALTKTGSLYYQCGSGDGGGATLSIYKIDINKGTAKSILSCKSQASDGAMSATVTCQ